MKPGPALATALALAVPSYATPQTTCANLVVADVVVLDQPIMFNRLGAQNPNWIVYALKRDVVALTPGTTPGPGNAQVRKDKRLRPLVLRVNEGDCLQVNLTNWLAGAANPFVAGDREPPMNFASPFLQIDDQVKGRFAGFHVRGLHLVGTIDSDASFVGKNANGLVLPNGGRTYTYYAPLGSKGTYLADSYGATFGGEATAGNAGQGMWAAVNVEPLGARSYRSQVTEEELRIATTALTDAGQPIINYEAVYPAKEADGVTDTIWVAEGKVGLPILNMRQGNAIVHSDLNAVIAGPNADGSFPASTYPLESAGRRNPTLPNRLEAFREFTVFFHDENSVGQAFPGWFDANPVTQRILHGVRDTFMVNYGSGGVGAEIIANRIGVGPMWDCLNCAYEEFFLSSFAVGDPAMLVDVPANVGLEACGITGGCADVGPKAAKAFFPDDPSNVHHSYQGDRVVFRNLHAGKEHHIFHLHNHQWNFDANDDNSNYIDAQAIGPASGYTYEINFGGSGNRNKTAGDAIFHCHFYPHFAQGMWELWRIHDVYETGTKLAVSGDAFHTEPFGLFDGTPAESANAQFPEASVRALPDGEILVGTPIPAVVPLPGKALPLMPGEVVVVQKNANPGVDDNPAQEGVQELPESSQAYVVDRAKNPGYPFWIAGVDCGKAAGGMDPSCAQGIVGQRPPTPALDMLNEAQAQALRQEDPSLFGALNQMAGDANGGWDGGLPRHALDGFAAVGGRTPEVFHQFQTKFNFDKEVLKAKPVWYPEGGTDLERAAMEFHATRTHPSFELRPDGSTLPAAYVTNGGRPQAGAPYFEPCIDDAGRTLFAGTSGLWFGSTPGGFVTTLGASPFNATSPRVYKGAQVQVDAVFNKIGYHYPQQRVSALWEDLAAFIGKTRPLEPLVIRNNTLDCTRFLHTNLVPKRFEVDDYEVTTPTDVIGQHIHLPKWDLPSADGSGNGWNYEDGTLSPGTVQERIHAINSYNPAGAGNPPNSTGLGANEPLVALAHPFFGSGQGGEYLGARTTIQRWMFDPVLNIHHEDRGLGVIFTHDHYGPSTVQQIGLYATVLAEPIGSTWVHNETGQPFHTRPDGGPTSWQAAILPGGGGAAFEPFREFWFQHSDLQSAYEPGVYIGAGPDGRPNGVQPDVGSFRTAVNPSVRQFANPVFPDVLRFPADCLDGTPRPCPEAISADDPGFLVANYRNEPVAWRVFDPNKFGPDGKRGSQADGLAGDLAFALQTRSDRKVAALNTRLGNTPYPELTADIGPGDPFTPMMRAYAGDLVRIKSQAGGDEEEHNFAMNGMKWLQGGSGHGRAPNAGWRASQHRGISEQFTFGVPISPFIGPGLARADYAYTHNTSQDGWWSGVWGLMRSYNGPRPDLFPLPTTRVPVRTGNANQFNGVCPRNAPVRSYDVTAVLANAALQNAVGATIPDNTSPVDNVGGPLDPAGGTLVYNPRDTDLAPPLGAGRGVKQGPLHDPTSILYVRTEDLDAAGVLLPGKPVEPLVLRANAGDCVVVTLRNRLPGDANLNGFFDDNPDLAGYHQLLPVVPRDKNSPQGMTSFGNNLVRPSSYVGLHAQLVTFDVTQDDGMVVGSNPPGNQVVPPGGFKTIRWYVGDVTARRAGNRFDLVPTPLEFGGANLAPADVIKQGQKGLVGALSVGPQGASVVETDTTWDHQQPDQTASRLTRASASLGGAIRDFALVFQDGINLRYADGTAVENMGSLEEAPGSTHKGINYATEPLWFRFGLQPDVPFGNAGTPGSLGAVENPEAAYSNGLVGGDPATPVLTASPGAPVRMHVLLPSGTSVDDLHNRGMVFSLNGHLWQRAPYVCPGQSDGVGLAGKCNWTNFGAPNFEVGSRAIGVNPIGMYLGAQESVLPGSHFDIVLPGAGTPIGGAGGTGPVPGDYLFRDQASFGNTSGVWGILRVE